MKISVIIPVYNEGAGVKTAYDAVRAVMEGELPSIEWELIFVDDASGDDSFDRVRVLAAEDDRVRGVRFTNNRGTHMAIRAGLDYACGDAACFLSCDLQEPPELIPRLLAKLDEGAQIVAAARNKRDDPWHTRVLAACFNRLARWLVSSNLPPGGASMFLLGPKALGLVRQFHERNLTLEGLFATTGLPQASIDYDRRARTQGVSKWTLSKKLKLFADFFVAHSYTPIRLVSIVGITVGLIGFLSAIYWIFNKYLGQPAPGWTSTMVVMLVLSGLQMVMLGIIGEYVWRTLDETRARPNYIVDELINEPIGPPGTDRAAPKSRKHKNDPFTENRRGRGR